MLHVMVASVPTMLKKDSPVTMDATGLRNLATVDTVMYF
jgi:hypothetical protein